jgi:fumarylacetoacetate (FAA) hydrolase
MTFGFDQLIAYAAYSRPLSAGTVIGSGTFSNADRAAGSVCIAERRAIEMLAFCEPRTPFLRDGERIRLESTDATGQSIFGAIDQRYVIAKCSRD